MIKQSKTTTTLFYFDSQGFVIMAVSMLLKSFWLELIKYIFCPFEVKASYKNSEFIGRRSQMVGVPALRPVRLHWLILM